MKVSRVLIGIGITALLGAALAQGFKQISVSLAGKNLKLDSVVVKGKTFVSLEQLQKALPNPIGGANQVAATTGCINQMLFNGAWRFRVQKVFYSIEEKKWFITAELRNAMNKTAKAHNSGASGSGEDITLITASGNTLNMGNNSTLEAQDKMILKDLAPGAGAVMNLEFAAEGDADKATKLLWAMSLANNFDKAPLSKEPARSSGKLCPATRNINSFRVVKILHDLNGSRSALRATSWRTASRVKRNCIATANQTSLGHSHVFGARGCNFTRYPGRITLG
jgi:hypothetical protein